MNQSTISGSITYLARIALPPDAIVTVRLEDTSRADAPAEIIAETSFEIEGKQVPLQFTLDYDASKIDPRHRYQVRAMIKVGGQLRFTSTQAYPVLTQGNGDKVDLRVDMVHGDASAASLADTYWKLIELNGQPSVVVENMREAHVVFRQQDNRLSGVGGVNRIGGMYSVDGNSLTIKLGPSTLMAGPEPLMQQEKAFNSALMRVNGYRIAGQKLELLDGETVLATFEARHMR